MPEKHVLRPIATASDTTFSPTIGEATEDLGNYLVATKKLGSAEEFQRVRSDALEIVKRCRPFRGPPGKRTGLVVGYVQSGKTMSMETVAALGRDNGCRLIILLAGVTKNLLRQNAERFRKDLRNADGEGNWRIINSQEALARDTEATDLRAACLEWNDPDTEESDKRTFIYAVLKNHAHLDWMRGVLANADLKHVPGLVIDDEADQAGLNVTPDEGPSTTYARILALRDALPHHTYLQYTATPQAPLLISIDDLLSPSFAELVAPGVGYTGGETFFTSDRSAGLIKSVPATEHFKPGKPPHIAPPQLIESFAVFAVGSAIARQRRAPKIRSMLVHPSARKEDHQTYLEFVKNIRDRWSRELSDKSSPDRQDVLEELKVGYDELAKTVANIPPFEDLLQPLKLSIHRMAIKLVNSEDASEVDWENTEEHVLVGGEKLNRGYTVEGLTVTYMPRDAGGWNADTLQQRARFFGYKQSYLDICRLYLHPDVRQAFEHYVAHERDIRKQLSDFRGQPLRNWRRAFFLDPSLKPTRSNVLMDGLYRAGGKDKDGWWRQRFADADAAARNEDSVRAFVESPLLKEVERWQTGGRPHKVAVVSIASVLSSVLSEYAAPNDSWGLYAQTMLLTSAVEKNADAQMLVVLMGGETRNRGIEETGAFPLFQGRSSKARGYVGDEMVRDASLPTLQVHRIHRKEGSRTTKASVKGPRPSLNGKDFYALAIFVPGSQGVVVQQTER